MSKQDEHPMLGAVINGKICFDRLRNKFDDIEREDSFIILEECFNALCGGIQDMSETQTYRDKQKKRKPIIEALIATLRKLLAEYDKLRTEK